MLRTPPPQGRGEREQCSAQCSKTRASPSAASARTMASSQSSGTKSSSRPAGSATTTRTVSTEYWPGIYVLYSYHYVFSIVVI